MKYLWLLFDADDTLFDFSKAEADALQWTLEGSGLTFIPDYVGMYAAFNQQVWREFEAGLVTSQELRTKRFELFFAAAGLQADIASISQLYLRNLALGTTLLPDAKIVIQTLRARYRLALVTNGLKDVQRPRLERSSLCDSFEFVFISEEIGAAKPAPAFFDHVFAALGRPPLDSVLIIGDSLTSDIQGGLNYGIDTCWFNPHARPASLPVAYQITRLHELLTLLA